MRIGSGLVAIFTAAAKEKSAEATLVTEKLQRIEEVNRIPRMFNGVGRQCLAGQCIQMSIDEEYGDVWERLPSAPLIWPICAHDSG